MSKMHFDLSYQEMWTKDFTFEYQIRIFPWMIKMVFVSVVSQNVAIIVLLGASKIGFVCEGVFEESSKYSFSANSS